MQCEILPSLVIDIFQISRFFLSSARPKKYRSELTETRDTRFPGIRPNAHLEKKFNWRKKIGRNDFFFFLNFCFDVEEIFFGSILKSLLMILQPKKKSWKMGFRENLFNQPNQSSRNYQKSWKRNFWPFFAESHSYLAPCLTQQRLHGQLRSTHRGCTKVNRIGLGTTKK